MHRLITICTGLAALLLAVGLGAAGSFAQDGTPTIPVKTQVWLDITATYEAEFNNALMTVTAMRTPTVISSPTVGVISSPTPIHSPTPDAPLTPGMSKTELAAVAGGVFMMGTTLEEGAEAVDECALYGSTCSLTWIEDSVPPHPVMVDSFAMEVYEVSAAQYVAFLNYLGPDSHLSGCMGQSCATTSIEDNTSIIAYNGETYSLVTSFYQNNPITGVTWFGAQAYCNAINRRLPTEAEWERAARGPQDFIYPWGNEFDTARANSSQSDKGGAEPVYTYSLGASPYGVFNMAGNVQEWVADWYAADTYVQQAADTPANPQGPDNGSEKVLRGGSWDTGPLFLRSVHRRSSGPLVTSAAVGFRCVQDQKGIPPSLTPTATAIPTYTFTPNPTSD